MSSGIVGSFYRVEVPVFSAADRFEAGTRVMVVATHGMHVDDTAVYDLQAEDGRVIRAVSYRKVGWEGLTDVVSSRTPRCCK